MQLGVFYDYPLTESKKSSFLTGFHFSCTSLPSCTYSTGGDSGGIYNTGTLTISVSTITKNSAHNKAGAFTTTPPARSRSSILPFSKEDFSDRF